MPSRRTAIALAAAVLFVATPALASLDVGNWMQGDTSVGPGPEIHVYGTGTVTERGDLTNWVSFTLDDLEVDGATNRLVKSREGDIAPSTVTWHDADATSRVCEADPLPGGTEPIRAVGFDIDAEIAAGRLLSDLANIRVHSQVDGSAVRHRPLAATATEPQGVLVESTDPVCVYWGDPTATTLADLTLDPPLEVDGTWAVETWNGTGDGTSLDLVDFTATPNATSVITTAAAPADACDRCANEIVGTVTPLVTGSYVFSVSADDVGRFELSPDADPANLVTEVDLTTATAAGSHGAAGQISAATTLTAGQTYAIRARSKDLSGTDHLEITWSIDGGPFVAVPAVESADASGTPGGLTHRRFDVVATADLTGPPDTTGTVTTSEVAADACDDCARRLSGYVLVSETGDHTFSIASDEEGTLRIATDGVPANATLAAWTDAAVAAGTYDAVASQTSATITLTAGDVIWIEADVREDIGSDHLSVAWALPSAPALDPPVLLTAAVMSAAAPAPGEPTVVDLGSVEGQLVTSGTFLSPVIDTGTSGTNVFGLVSADASAGVDLVVESADDPAGPWTTVAVDAGDPVPISFDGRRYVRLGGTIDVDGDTVGRVGVEFDIAAASSSDATTSVTLADDHSGVVLRITGSVGTQGTIDVSGDVAGEASVWVGDGSGPVASLAWTGSHDHHVGVDVDPTGTATAITFEWRSTDDGGAVVFHDLDVTITR